MKHDLVREHSLLITRGGAEDILLLINVSQLLFYSE
jgi:hypothetical protein